jgi:hypothetical protein
LGRKFSSTKKKKENPILFNHPQLFSSDEDLTWILFFQSVMRKKKEATKKGGQPGIEPGTSSTQTKNHTPRPLALFLFDFINCFIPSFKFITP